MYLSDVDILREMEAGHIICEPFDKRNLSYASIDLRLGNNFIDERESHWMPSKRCNVKDGSGLLSIDCSGVYPEPFVATGEHWLQPGKFLLAQTLERVGSNCKHIVCQLADKSTLARMGLSTFFAAGFTEPAHVLNITLELKNHSNFPIVLVPGQHICAIRFAYLHSPSSRGYDGKYIDSLTVRAAE